MNFTKTIINAIKYWVNSKLNNYVEIVEGKGLSTEDYTTEEKEKVASIEAGAQKNIQPDWNQNDESADDYVKNRPFYTIKSVETELFSTTISSWENQGGMYGVQLTLESEVVLTVGETYKVIWNGVEYETVAWNLEGSPGIGDKSAFDGSTSTGEPFLIGLQGTMGIVYALDLTSNTDVRTVSIILSDQDIVKLPMQYLPDGYPYKESYVGEIVPETTVNIENISNPALDPFAIEFTADKTYTVTWDGVEYECVSYIAEGPNTPSIGNGEAAGATGGNGEPFFCTVYNGQVMLFATEDGSHTISISGTGTRVVKMANEYLPDSDVVLGVIDSWSYNFHELNLARGANAQQLIKAADSGKLAGVYIDHSSEKGWIWFSHKYYDNDIGCNVYVFTGISDNFSNSSIKYRRFNIFLLPEAFNGNQNMQVLIFDGSDSILKIGSAAVGGFLRLTSNYNGIQADSVEITPSLIGAVPSPKSAKVGQTLVVKSVDENGIPTELEAVNSFDNINLVDQVNGYTYIVCMRNGNLVTYCQVEKIEVTTMPTTTEYVAGEAFDPTGMVITATAYDGTTKEVSDYTYSAERLTEDMTSIEIVYTDGGVNCSVTVPITVNPFDAETILVDFEYTDNGDGTYTITSWKGTYNGEASTEMIVPDYGCIIV